MLLQLKTIRTVHDQGDDGAGCNLRRSITCDDWMSIESHLIPLYNTIYRGQMHPNDRYAVIVTRQKFMVFKAKIAKILCSPASLEEILNLDQYCEGYTCSNILSRTGIPGGPLIPARANIATVVCQISWHIAIWLNKLIMQMTLILQSNDKIIKSKPCMHNYKCWLQWYHLTATIMWANIWEKRKTGRIHC